MHKFHSIFALSNEHLEAMGRIAVLWTNIERQLEFLIWQLSPLKQPLAQAVTTHLSTQITIDISKSLINELLESGELKNSFIEHLNYISNQLRKKRNDVIHGTWGPTNNTDKVSLMSVTARGEVKVKFGEEMSANDFLGIASEIDSAGFKLTKLTFEASKLLGRVAYVDVGNANG
jgi:hypothetical protein